MHEALEVIRGTTDVLIQGELKLTNVVASDVDLISQVDEAERFLFCFSLFFYTIHVNTSGKAVYMGCYRI